jgi:hypothetical protein
LITILRALSILFAAIAWISAFGFLLLYLGGYTGALEHERITLIPLIAGLAAAALHGWRVGAISQRAAVISLGLLAIWVGFVGIRL